MRWEREAANRVPSLLQGWLDAPGASVRDSGGRGSSEVDIAVGLGGREFLVEVNGSDDIAAVDAAARKLERADASNATIKLVAVPFMGPKARRWARARGISWLDLSGNAEIRGLGLCILVSGQKNQYAEPGRPSNPFTPRYARVSRALLVHPDRWWRQTELTDEIGLPSGSVSKAVQRLHALDLLERNQQGAIRARQPSLLLDSWAQRYRFDDHSIRRYHTVARTGPETLRAVAEALTREGATWAATGLSAAWLYTGFADFRLNTFFVEHHPRDPEAFGLRPVDRGENVWVVVPQDEGVFYGKSDLGGWCVHPAQVYLDLGGHPERAAEAATALASSEWLTWSR